MPLLRRMARTAVVAGTATAVAGNVSRRQNQRWAAQEAQEQAPPPAAPAAEDPIQMLQQLGQLHEQGVLTDEEFSAQKAKLLNA